MQIQRLIRHLIAVPWAARRKFDEHTLRAIEEAIAMSERQHGGEIRFAVESNLTASEILRGVTPRERALACFGSSGVWDTEANNGVLIYLLLADHDVEIVADRGCNDKVEPMEWERICHEMEQAFRRGAYADGVVRGVQAVGEVLKRHYPATDRNELPNKPLIV